MLVADQEGTIGQEAAKVQEEGIISPESTLLWPTSFEEANFSDAEIIEMIADIVRVT